MKFLYALILMPLALAACSKDGGTGNGHRTRHTRRPRRRRIRTRRSAMGRCRDPRPTRVIAWATPMRR